jgi:penicillin-binding protein 1A
VQSGKPGGFRSPAGAQPRRPVSPRIPASRETPTAKRLRTRRINRIALGILVFLAMTTGCMTGLMLVYSVDLPQIADLQRYHPDTTTELYDTHGRPFGSFALERRVVVPYSSFAPVLRQAVISIEDKNFESHWGVNVFRVAGSIYHDLASKGRAQGASTLTMQLARNLFLSSERTFGRKLQEVFLSIQIERKFTKQQIFTLYANQIYLGHGVYGFEAGSEYFFSKHVSELTLPEAALLAGLPKGPVGYSPILYPDRSIRRRNLVLQSMESDGVITKAEAEAAKAEPLGLHLPQPTNSVAPWFIEEVRRELERKFGTDQVHEAGMRIYTTLDLDLQQAANKAVEDGLAAYERRKGWHGHLLNAIALGNTVEHFKHPDWVSPVVPGIYVHALVLGVLPGRITATAGSQRLEIQQAGWNWTGEKNASQLVKIGDVIYVRVLDDNSPDEPIMQAALEQDSGAEGSLMAVDNSSGDIVAMVGGRDFYLSQYNRATQAQRQTGSSFKPYVYTAAVEVGATPQQMILDTPATFYTGSGSYTPHDYEGNYLGSITLLKAFADSRNIPALRLAEQVGMRKVIDTAHRFGVTSNIPNYLPVALGAVEITLEQQVGAYSVFPNDGVLIEPHLIRKVANSDGMTLTQDSAKVTEVTTNRTARTMMVLLKEAILSGTAKDAVALHHPLGGKTGTTSDYTDAWFIGFSPSVTCGVWVGYDSRQSLGDKETGAIAALPIWSEFMRVAIAGKPEEQFPGDH